MSKRKPFKPYWLDTVCSVKIESSTVPSARCGLRQFQTPSGATCAAGHGGAEGTRMTDAGLATWQRQNKDVKPPWDGDDLAYPDGELARKRSPRVQAFLAGTKAPSTEFTEECPETGGPHNFQLVEPDNEDGPMKCVDCDKVVSDDEPGTNIVKTKREVGNKPWLCPDDVAMGDVVVLISGGPLMTVLNAPKSSTDQMVECLWFNKNGDLCRSTFLVGTLRAPRLRPGNDLER